MDSNERRRQRYRDDEEYRNRVKAQSRASAERMMNDPERHRKSNERHRQQYRVKSTLKDSGMAEPLDIMYDDSAYGDETNPAIWCNNTEEGHYNEQCQYAIRRAMKKCLTDREQDILSYLFGLFGEDVHSLEEVADMYNLTRNIIRKIRETALRKLKYGAGDDILRLISESRNRRGVVISEGRLRRIISESIRRIFGE